MCSKFVARAVSQVAGKAGTRSGREKRRALAVVRRWFTVSWIRQPEVNTASCFHNRGNILVRGAAPLQSFMHVCTITRTRCWYEKHAIAHNTTKHGQLSRASKLRCTQRSRMQEPLTRSFVTLVAVARRPCRTPEAGIGIVTCENLHAGGGGTPISALDREHF